MKLEKLIKGLEVVRIKGNPETEIKRISYHSRKVREGDLFAAIPGTVQDGHAFIPEARARGASAFLVSEPIANSDRPVILVQDVRLAMGMLAGRILGNPSHDLEVTGITGTNGKTTLSYLLEAIVNASGKKAGVIGTVNYRYQGKTRPAPTTTPESVDIHEMLCEMKHAGVSHVFLEVSSHALDQRRVSGLRLKQAVFTNLSQDHLDYHHDMETYFSAKEKLFSEVLQGKWEIDRPAGVPPGASVINMDDSYGLRLIQKAPGRVIGYGMDNPDVQVRARILKLDPQGLELEITRATQLSAASQSSISGKSFESLRERFKVRSSLLGRHNTMNIIAAAASAFELGLDPEAVKKGIASLQRVPGRLEPVQNAEGIIILVDYAHTPDALAQAIRAAREISSGRLIVVFGCGGDRDRRKRPHMGEIAGRDADLVVITSDNPRTEDPRAIIDEIVPGIKNSGARELSGVSKAKKGYMIEENRKEAIELAIAGATPGDVILIAGKGHEDYQIIGTRRIHFDDREVAARALARRIPGKRSKAGT
jgi:UDP-N-acetylmuramoyl-L-alanyl-D-glutamate--2,6-diaminopimelate ligase